LPIEVPVKGIIITGHIDMIYMETGEIKVCDIKTLSTHTYEEIVGKKILKPGSYADMKRRKAISQANIYTVSIGATRFSILWIDKDSLSYKLEDFTVNEVEFGTIVDKLVDVSQAIKRYRDGDKTAKPKPCGNMICNYCDAHKKWCLGKASLNIQGISLDQVEPEKKPKVKRGFV
jgi:hypothetical protein